MVFVKPDFYDAFFCKADACGDTCCAGWEIDIDPQTLDRYRRTTGAFGEKLRKNIDISGETASFHLLEGDICPFLEPDGLCEIYRTLGGDALCEICREHPRFYTWLNGRTEAGLGLCCEKACELLLQREAPLTFLEEDDGQDPPDAETDELIRLRKGYYALVSDRKKPLTARMEALLAAACRDHPISLSPRPISGRKTADLLLLIVLLMKETEPINSAWTAYIQKLAQQMPHISTLWETTIAARQNTYERLLVYLFYRHFIPFAQDGRLLQGVCFCLVSLLFVLAEDMYAAAAARERRTAYLDNIKRYSQQIEYSAENVAFVADKAEKLLLHA